MDVCRSPERNRCYSKNSIHTWMTMTEGAKDMSTGGTTIEKHVSYRALVQWMAIGTGPAEINGDQARNERG